jgi:hypothetical protein
VGLALAAGLGLACGSSSTANAPSPTGGGAGGSTAAGGQGPGGGATGSTTTATAGAGGSEQCPPPPACDAPLPDPGAAQPWKNPLTPLIVTSQGAPQHRGRDLLLRATDPQWVLGKFAYGPADKDLKGEDVDIYLLRGCGDSWEKLGTATTTTDGEHPTVEGVEDTGGRIYFPIAAEQKLAEGRHRLHLVVGGDLSSTDAYIEVLPEGAPLFVSDVDGTLTSYETEEFVLLLTGELPVANEHAAEALGLLASKGARPFYLTARPEWLTGRTRDFLAERGFPPGVVHTTLSKIGALGSEATSYKTAELGVVADRGLSVRYAFGNTASDGDAYEAAAVQPLDHRVFYQFDDEHGGRRIESYGELLGELGALDPCW